MLKYNEEKINNYIFIFLIDFKINIINFEINEYLNYFIIRKILILMKFKKCLEAINK